MVQSGSECGRQQAQEEMGALRRLEGGPIQVDVVQTEEAWGYGLSGTAACR